MNRTPSWTICAAAASVTAAAVLLWTIAQPERDLQIFAGLFLIVLIAAVVLLDRVWGGRREIGIKELILSSYAIFLGLGMIAGVFRPDWRFDIATIGLAYAGLFCFLFGFSLCGGAPAPAGPGRRMFAVRQNQLFGLSVLFFAAGFAFLLLEWMLYGRLQSYANSAAGISASALPKPYVNTFTELTGPGLLLALILLRRGAPALRAGVLIGLCGLTVAWYAYWGARINFAWLAVGFLLVWKEIPNRQGLRRIGFAPWLFMALAVAAMLALGVLRTDWNFVQARSQGLSGVEEQVESSLDAFYQFRRTREYFPARADFLMGYSLYGIAVNPVPRAFWPGKPVGAGRLASILYDHNRQGSLGLSLPGELYANFGIPGCLLGMFLFGALAAAIHRWYRRQRGEPCALVAYILLTEYFWFEIRGDMLDATAPILYQLLPFVICAFAVTAMNSRVRLAVAQSARRVVGRRRPAFSRIEESGIATQ